MKNKSIIPLNVLICLYQNENISLSELERITGYSLYLIKKLLIDNDITIRGLSDSLKGREITWKDKISQSNMGNLRSKESRQKMSERHWSKNGKEAWNKGLTKSSNSDRIIYGVQGENHWNWKGGISSLQIRLRQTSQYKEWRSKVFYRDNYICQCCKEHSRNLEAHHIKTFSDILSENTPTTIEECFDIELLWDTGNGITYCKGCHKKIHKGAVVCHALQEKQKESIQP